MRFPTIVAHDLEGRRYEVPGDLPVGPRIIVIAFQRWHTGLIEGWQPELDRVVHDNPGTSWWEVPALSRIYTPARPYIDGGMRAGIPDPDARRQTLTDAVGEVTWMGSGEADADGFAGLEAAVGVLASVPEHQAMS